jgi:hypothetical protein
VWLCSLSMIILCLITQICIISHICSCKLLSDRGILWLPYKWIWIKAIPQRHKFFLWLFFMVV